MAQIEQRPADPGNYTKGRQETTIDRVVVHVADGSYAGTLAWFADPACSTSAHYTVATDGRVGQSVQEEDTAWHAGLWPMNLRSIGIEHEGQPSRGPWTPSDAQLQASAALVAAICQRYSIPADREHIIGHSEVIPDRAARKNCPGPTWPWDRYIGMVRAVMQPQGQTVRLFDPATNQQIGTGTLIPGTDKVYVMPPERAIS